jgi:hypothetical protein
MSSCVQFAVLITKLYTGWFRKENLYFGMWQYLSLWEKAQRTFLLTIRYIQGDSGGKSIFWDVIVSVIVGKSSMKFSPHNALYTGWFRRKTYILGRDCIGHCGKSSMNVSPHNAFYTGWFRRKNLYFWMWFYRSLWEKSSIKFSPHSAFYTGWFRRKNQCFGTWLYWYWKFLSQ